MLKSSIQLFQYNSATDPKQDTIVSLKVESMIPESKVLVNEWLSAYYKDTVTQDQNCKFIDDNYTKGKLISATDWLTSKTSKPCLLIQGLTGNGKSTLAAANNKNHP